MKISKKAYYGLRAIVALAQSNRALSTHALSISEQLPEEYLEKILQGLRRAKIVEATKGISGGYALAHHACDISVWEVLRELDGPLKTFSAPGTSTLPCFQSSHCQTNEVWRLLEHKIEDTLSAISIANLIPKNTPRKNI